MMQKIFRKHIYLALLLGLALPMACPAPVPEPVGCETDSDCQSGRACDPNTGLCVVQDAGELSDSNQFADGTIDEDATVIEDAAIADVMVTDAETQADAAFADVEGQELDVFADSGLPEDAGLVDSADFDAGLADVDMSDNGMSDNGMSDTGMSDTGMSDTDMPDTEMPDMGPEPHANAGPDQQVAFGALVLLSADGSVFPVDAQNISYQWQFTTKPQGSTVALTGAAQSSAAFVSADVHGVYVVELTITVDGEALPRDSMQVSVNNRAPQANAGDDAFVYNGSSVQLDGSASSDPDADTLSYQWSLSDPDLGSFDDASSATATFTPAESAEGEVELTLTVSDGHGGSDQDAVVVSVQYNLPPVIEPMNSQAADHQCSAGSCNATFSLAAQVTEPEDESYDLQWTLLTCPGGAASNDTCPSGLQANFADPYDLTTLLELDADEADFVVGEYVAQLTATDSFGNSASAQVLLTVGNRPVTGNDGSASAVHTYGGGSYSCQISFAVDVSDPDGDRLRIVNYQVSPSGTVSQNGDLGATFLRTSSSPDSSFLGPYTATLTIEDGKGSDVEVDVTLNCSNTAPLLTGTPTSTVNVNHSYSPSTYKADYSLSGSVTDAESDPVTCVWSVPSPVSNVLYSTLPKTISNANASVALSAEMSSSTTAVVNTHGFSLECYDAFASVTRSITLAVGNRGPIADAGADLTVNHTYAPATYSATVALTGASASDPDGDPLTIQWTEAQINGSAASASRTGTTTLNPTYNYSGGTNVVGARDYTLTVTDPLSSTAQDVRRGTVGNRAPTANAGADMSADHSYSGNTYSASFNLNGRTTKATVSDPDGDPLTNQWSVPSVPSGVTYLFSDTAVLNPTANAQGTTRVVGTHTLRLTTTDPFGASDPDDVVVTGLNRAPTIVSQPSLADGEQDFAYPCNRLSTLQLTCYVDGVEIVSKPYNRYVTDAYTVVVYDADGDPLDVALAGSVSKIPNTMMVAAGTTFAQTMTVHLEGSGNQTVAANVRLGPGVDDPRVDCASAGTSLYFTVESRVLPGPVFGNFTEGFVATQVTDAFSSISANQVALRVNGVSIGLCE